jgi:hypothetical protein
VKTVRVDNGGCVTVNCEVYSRAVLKRPINATTDPKSVYGHFINVTILSVVGYEVLGAVVVKISIA